MKSSEMTDNELRLAIAEELGWEFIPYPDDAYKKKRHWWRSPEGGMKNQFGERWFLHLPLDWPDDIAAAIRLLDDKCWRIYHYPGTKWKYSVGIFAADEVTVLGDAKNKSLSRAICEAWLTARRNNG